MYEKNILLGKFAETINQKNNNLLYKFISYNYQKEINYNDAEKRIKSLAAYLQSKNVKGKRVIIAEEEGINYALSILSCFYAGAIAVPIQKINSKRYVSKINKIIEDSGAEFIIYNNELHSNIKIKQKLNINEISTDGYQNWKDPEVSSDQICLLQYTSGSTSDPKGVKITYRNIFSNLEIINQKIGKDGANNVCSWLPPYHDMGLIGGILYPIFCGSFSILILPQYFLNNPLEWLRIISKYKVSISPAPNFAYDLCVNAQQFNLLEEDIDLKGWRVALNGAEPINIETIKNFTEAFQSYGFQKSSFYCAYGMAEATLMVSGGNYEIKNVDNKDYVSVGKVASGIEVGIFNIVKNDLLLVDQIGEICIQGKSVTSGYWNKDNNEYFFLYNNKLFLKTGDLGFLDGDGNLYISGRIKDLIIINGRNVLPHDVESTVFRLSKFFINNACAVFQTSINNKEQIILLQEIHRHCKDFKELTEQIRNIVFEEYLIKLDRVLLITQGQIPKTSSGKIQRFKAKELFLNNDLKVLYEDKLIEIKETNINKNISDNNLFKIILNYIYISFLS
jgi:acyl-CoA synthetase (AMP-forming)/AMP-acid ligase II